MRAFARLLLCCASPWDPTAKGIGRPTNRARGGWLFQTIIINIEESTMNNRILLVVGDKFASYVKSKDAITVSQLRGLLSLPVHMLPGQSRTVLVQDRSDRKSVV